MRVPSDGSLISAGLKQGDQFRLLLITENKRRAGGGDIESYSEFVQRAAADGPLNNRPFAAAFWVVGSTAAVDACDKTFTNGTGVPIYWLNGNKVADGYADFYDETWDAETGQRTNDGSLTTQLIIYTGSQDDGTASAHPVGRSDDDTDRTATVGYAGWRDDPTIFLRRTKEWPCKEKRR